MIYLVTDFVVTSTVQAFTWK